MKSFNNNKKALVVAMGLGFTVPAAEAIQGINTKAVPNSEAAVDVKTPSLAFERIASFPVFLNTDISNDTVAEIVAASADGNTLVYTDGKTGNIGFVDITNPVQPESGGVTAVGGEPTSVAVTQGYALVAVNTSPSYVAPSGKLVVIDVVTKDIIAEHLLGGQPDSVAVSPDGRYAVVVIENERDEDLGNGEPPQAPGGFMVIVDLVGAPTDWELRNVDFTGLPDLYPNDPEPEYVDINHKNVAVVTLQENNHIILVDLESGDALLDFDAGVVNLEQVDSDDNGLIQLQDTLTDVAREPDGVSWITHKQFATANEGDLFGGGRGFTIYDVSGNVVHESGNSVEHHIVQHGHYPEKRSDNKGNEPENVESGEYNGEKYLFVGSERASAVLVYKVRGNSGKAPHFVQLLPTPVKPEGLLAIPQRNLFVVAGEEDARDDKIRSALSIYRLQQETSYPAIVSRQRADGTPIPWGALSGLAMDNTKHRIAYTIHDSFYNQSRVYTLKLGKKRNRIIAETMLNDSMGKLAAVSPGMVNTDGSVNLDMEGIATRAAGGFWIASEGAGTTGDVNRPVTSNNMLLSVANDGMIEQVVTLPQRLNDNQLRFGFEGVASVMEAGVEMVYVAFQRGWSVAGDTTDHARIGQYNTASGEWKFFYYPLEMPESANGGWVGLLALAYVGNDRFAVIERDNQGGPDAAIKRIYSFSIAGLTPAADSVTPAFPVLTKTLEHDLMSDLKATGGLVLEKIEGLAVTKRGHALVVNDNDGVDDSNGETQLLRLKSLFK